ncbi:MAG: hypothetical protein FIA92_01600 [Chloroflexi bacterium]|nr:hypothetical protein [Chloroflexota bacterium]
MATSSLASRLEALVAFLPELQSPGFTMGRWAGGERLADGSTSMPYYELGERGEAFLGGIAAGGWVQPFDWMTWLATPDGQALANDPGRMERATPEDLGHILTAIVRSERFGDGNLEGAVTSGLFLRIVRRAAVLLEAERGRG